MEKDLIQQEYDIKNAVNTINIYIGMLKANGIEIVLPTAAEDYKIKYLDINEENLKEIWVAIE